MTSAQQMRVGAGGIPPPPSPAARTLSIVERVKGYPVAVAAPGDFACRDAGPADAEWVLHDPGLSLYCLDHDHRRALFVRTPAGLDLTTASPFYYQAQYEHATELVAVPYGVLHALAEQARFDPRRLVLIYSTGRCGSTLVVRALATLGGMIGLSEPDVFTQLVMLGRSAERDRLARSCLRLMCAAAGGRPVAMKPRSFVIELAGALRPARAVFLHRDAVSWARSTARAFSAYDPAQQADPASVQDRLGLLVPMVAAHRARKGRLLTVPEVMACQWVSQMERALALRHAGHLFTAGYETLIADPKGTLGELFAFCGLPAPTGLDGLLDRDSQEGTTLSRQAAQERDCFLDEAEFTAAVTELWGQVLP